jgi:hypothetical protein
VNTKGRHGVLRVTGARPFCGPLNLAGNPCLRIRLSVQVQ